MMALACDYRVMNIDKGFLCVNEIDIGLPLTPGMAACISSKTPRTMWAEVMLGGKRIGAKEALQAKMVDHAKPQG
jgi:enoyl-CoA hydratase/carnithine racemase